MEALRNNKRLDWLVWALSLSLLAAAWLLMMNELQNEKELRINSAYHDLSNLAHAFEEHIQQAISAVNDDLQFTAEHVIKEDAQGSIYKAWLDRLGRKKAYSLLAAVNHEGRLMLSNQPATSAIEFMQTDIFRHHQSSLSDALFFGKPIAYGNPPRFHFPVSRRISDDGTGRPGMALALINPDFFSNFYNRMDFHDSMAVVVMGTHDFTIRFRQVADDKSLGQVVPNAPVYKHLKNRPEGTFSDIGAVANRARFMAYRQMDGFPLVVVVVVDEQTLLAPFQRKQEQTYWYLTAMSIMVFAFTFLLVRTLRRNRGLMQRYHSLVEQSSEALALSDIQTQEIVEVNHRFTELFGYSLPEDAPLYVNKVVKDSQANLDRLFNITLKNQRILQPEPRLFLHKNGTVVPVERAGTVIGIDGQDYMLAGLRDMTAERQRQAEMARDVELARQLQQALLPVLPESSLLAIRSLYHPSHFVSGDSYHLEWRNEGKMLRGFLIDITGHGLATALQAASVNALLHNAAANLTLLEQMNQINVNASRYFAEDSFAAMLGFELDFAVRELRVIGAGITHFYANGSKVAAPGMFVGICAEPDFTQASLSINVGDSFHFLTDGFTDVLEQSKNAGFWSTGGKDFDEDVDALEKLVAGGELRDDASGICMKVIKLL